MTSRGNPSISPPAQIPQQRHGTALPSGTPPPTQYFQGQSPALPQGGFEFITPQQPLYPYQAYGSAVNEVRAQSGNGARGGPPQQTMHQGGAAFYQQPSHNMRPQHPQPGQVSQQYYISAGQMPSNIRPRHHHPNQSQQMVYVPQSYPGNNVVIAQNMQYQPRPQMHPYYTSVPQNPYPTLYISNGASSSWQGPRMSQAGPVTARTREKKIIEIKDPSTGKDVTEELINSAHADHAEPEEEPAPNQQTQEIGKLFTRLVADRLNKPSDDTNTVDSQVGSIVPPTPVVPSSQQHQPPPLPSTQQPPPPHMMRPGPPNMGPPRMPPPTHMMPPRPGMMQQQQSVPHVQPPATPPHHDIQRMNFSMPPPQILRQPTPAQVYSTAQQHLVRHPQQPQPVVQQQPQPVLQPPPAQPQAIRSPNVPVMTTSQPSMQQQPSAQAQAQAQAHHQQHLQQSPSPVQLQQSAPMPDVPASNSMPSVSAPEQLAAAPSNSPPQTEDVVGPPSEESPAATSAPKVPSPPAKENTPPETTAQKVTPPPAEEAPKALDSRDEMPQGASNRGPKDGRKGKKNKRDLNTKEIGGSDMDAFIDDKDNDASKPPLAAADQSTTVAKVSSELGGVTAEDNSTAAAVAAVAAQDATHVEEDHGQEQQPESHDVKESAPSMEEAMADSDVNTVEPKLESMPPEDVSVVSKDDGIPEVTAAPVNNQNQSDSESQRPEQAPEIPETPEINIVPSDSDSNTASTVAAGSEEVTERSQAPINDENIPPKDFSLRPKMEEGKTAPASKDDDADPPPKAPLDKPSGPVKKEGKDKLQYDRAYLMELRECASSQTKPEGLPNLEIILDRPVSRAVGGTSPDFTPTFFQPSTPQRHPQQMGKSASRGRGRPGDMQMAPRIIKSVSIQNDVKALHQSEKPWKPSPKQLATGEIASKVENLEAKALFILNRLTPTNFEPLSSEMMALRIGNYEQLQQLVKIFFDKVTLETKFVEAYAKLCKKMCQLKVPPPPGVKENQATFRVLLLTKCQTEFESDKTIVFEDPEEKRKKLEAEIPEGPDKKDQIETTLYHMKLRRLKFYGNIRFIGELFKLSMLTENIMHDCIFRLLKARDDESLLSLCQLITTVGSILDTEKAKQRMDQYFAQMVKIAEERKSRIKFTLKDAIELRQNNWVPRKEQTGPKKIDEVRQDFHQEQQTKQFLQNQPLPPRNDPQPSSRRGSKQRQEEKPNDDGWNTVGSKSIRIDASKMKFSKSMVDENNIQLGPGGGMNKFSMWSKGSGAAQPSQDSPMNRPTNRFSALPSDEDRRFQRSPSRGDSGVNNRGLRQGNTAGHGRGKIMGRSSTEGERRDVLASARSIVGGRSQNSSRDNSWNREDRRSIGPRGSREGENSMGPPRTISLRPSAERTATPSAKPTPAVGGYGVVKKAAPKSEEEMEHSAKTILDEYLNIRDLKEAKLCVMELEGQRYLYVFITASINNVLERSDKDRNLTGQFFYEIVKDNLISLDKFIKGLSEVLQFAEDMVIDIPKMWTNLAQLIAPLLVGGSMPWSQLKPIVEPHLSPMCSAKLLAEILLISKGLVSEAEIARMWQASGLSWDAFLPADRIADFIKDKKLEFLQGATDSSSRQVSQDHIMSELVKLIQDGKSNGDVQSYIKENIPREVEEKILVRVLITAVIKASLSAAMKPNNDILTSRQELLQHYIKTPELELQALYAIQALMHRLEHPSGVIASVFDFLYNEEIISEEAFKQWEVSTDEQEGKGACSLQLTQFFTWLRENEEMEAS